MEKMIVTEYSRPIMLNKVKKFVQRTMYLAENKVIPYAVFALLDSGEMVNIGNFNDADTAEIMYKLDKNECRRTLVRWICRRNETRTREVNERIKEITDRLNTINKTEQALFEQKLQQEISQETFTNITVSMNAESELLRTEYGKLLILLDSFDDQKKSVTRFLTKVGTFADMEITKDDRYILEQLIEKVTIQEIETKIKVLVHFVDIGLISVAAL